MTTISELHKAFIRERTHLQNVTPRTLDWHNQSWISVNKHLPELESMSPTELTKARLNEYVIAIKQTGIKPVTINTYLRSLNAFLNWLHANEYTSTRLNIPKLKTEEELIKVLPEESLAAFVKYKPTDYVESRIHALTVTVIETGMRINEALSLKVPDVDFDNLVMRLQGKGRKERLVPFSIELRKLLWKFYIKHQMNLPDDRYFFCTRTGGKMMYDNARRDYVALCSRLNIEQLGSFHRIRHTFATNYLRNGGNVLYLSNILGHTSTQVTARYVHVDIEALREAQTKTSLLAKLKNR